jgi:hypothetical protein
MKKPPDLAAFFWNTVILKGQRRCLRYQFYSVNLHEVGRLVKRARKLNLSAVETARTLLVVKLYHGARLARREI